MRIESGTALFRRQFPEGVFRSNKKTGLVHCGTRKNRLFHGNFTHDLRLITQLHDFARPVLAEGIQVAVRDDQ